MTDQPDWAPKNLYWLLPFVYFFSRIIIFLATVPYSFYGFGDFTVYYRWTVLPGWPFLNYWMEYPPLFPFLSETIYRLTGSSEFLYDFVLNILLAIAGAMTILLFYRIAAKLYGEKAGLFNMVIFFAFFSFLPYTWWYYDLIPVCLMMAGIWMVINQRDTAAGIWIGLGILAKWFPLFLLPGLLGHRPLKSFLKTALIAVGMTGIVFAALYLAAPTMTKASLLSQPSRSSWETIWAMIDGNQTTGAFVLPQDRFHPEEANIPRGNPAVISTNITLAVFCVIGLWLLWRRKNFSPRGYIAFTGITWALFLLWSPGWSPQWILYLIPIMLLTLPMQKGVLITMGLIALTIFEWPFLLMRSFFESLWIIAPLRMLILIILIIQWARICRQSPPTTEPIYEAQVTA